LLQAQSKPVIDFTNEEPEDTMMEISDVTGTSAAQAEAQADAVMGTSDVADFVGVVEEG
jgi:hypothetical protein